MKYLVIKGFILAWGDEESLREEQAKFGGKIKEWTYGDHIGRKKKKSKQNENSGNTGNTWRDL